VPSCPIVPRNRGARSVSLLKQCHPAYGRGRFHTSALALIKAGAVWHNQIMTRSNLCILFHIADDSLPAVVHMDRLDPDKLLPPELSPPRFNDFRRD
jgi:hypothetical protein